MQVWLLKRAFRSPQLLLIGTASLVLLTWPAALAVAANMIANGGVLTPVINGPTSDREFAEFVQLRQGIRFLGMLTNAVLGTDCAAML